MRITRVCTVWVGIVLIAGSLWAAPDPATATATPPAGPAPDAAAWNVSLNGTWEFAPEGSADFAPAKVPGFWDATPQAKAAGFEVYSQWKSGTYRRDFDVPEGMTGAILDFDMIRWGGEVLINGKSAGSYDLGHSPVSFNISGLIHPGRRPTAGHLPRLGRAAPPRGQGHPDPYRGGQLVRH